jgi:hypothetical protein
MVTDDDYLNLAREFLLLLLDLNAEIGALRIALQKRGIPLEELQSCRAELERRLDLEGRRKILRALRREDLSEALRSFSGTVQ